VLALDWDGSEVLVGIERRDGERVTEAEKEEVVDGPQEGGLAAYRPPATLRRGCASVRCIPNCRRQG